MSPCRQVRPPFQILVPVNIEETYGQRVFMNVDEHEQLGSASLGELFPTEKSGRGTRAPVIEGPSSHKTIHRVTADTGIELFVREFRDRAVRNSRTKSSMPVSEI